MSKKNSQNILDIKNLHAETVEEKLKILKGINLTIKTGEIHAIMGPNGSGKTTLCKILMGHPKYKITQGEVLFNKKTILKLTTDERAKLGIFLGFQNPIEVAGVSLRSFLRIAKNKIEKTPVSPIEFAKELGKNAKKFKIDLNLIENSINDGASGGEKKRTEILQMTTLKPKIALLDEVDSGLDIDALKIVSKNINEAFKETSPGILLITHYQRILEYITPNFVHIMSKGKIIKSGGKNLATQLEKTGYENIIKQTL
jgi:Fe-S cluster assembly ATP-binding protein